MVIDLKDDVIKLTRMERIDSKFMIRAMEPIWRFDSLQFPWLYKSIIRTGPLEATENWVGKTSNPLYQQLFSDSRFLEKLEKVYWYKLLCGITKFEWKILLGSKYFPARIQLILMDAELDSAWVSKNPAQGITNHNSMYIERYSAR